MTGVRQGEVIRIEGSGQTALALSKDFFNASGMAIVCPVVAEASADALHVPVTVGAKRGVAMVEQLKSLDMSARHFKILGHVPFEQVQEITDTVQSLFDYYPFSI